VVDKVALGRVLSVYFGFHCQSSFLQILHNHNHPGQATIGQSVAVVPSGPSWTPPPTKRINKITGKVRFHWSLYVKSQNSRVSPATDSHENQDTPLQDQEVAVWCGISRNRIIGPIFLSDTINSGRYCEVILYPLTEYLSFPGYFQEDGATAHTSRVSMTLLRDMFGDRIISKNVFPPPLPDLVPPDYYMWGKMNFAV
jgi:hypothetical protein